MTHDEADRAIAELEAGDTFPRAAELMCIFLMKNRNYIGGISEDGRRLLYRFISAFYDSLYFVWCNKDTERVMGRVILNCICREVVPLRAGLDIDAGDRTSIFFPQSKDETQKAVDEKMTPDLWREFFTGVPQFRGDLSLLALAGEQITGFCVNWVVPAPALTGQTHEGWVEAIGVIPGWRGRGLASALLAASLAQLKDQGLHSAAMDVDAENPTGALRLHEKHGFKTAHETIHFVKILE